MIRADLVLTGLREVATLAVGPIPRRGPAMTELGRISDAAIAIDQGRFVFVGRERPLRREVRLRSGGRRLDLGGRVALPGLVDAHTHLLFAGDRLREVPEKVRGGSYAEIAKAGGGIYSTVEATRAAPAARLVREALGRLARMARAGTTTLEVKSGYALDHEGELRLLSLVPRLARHSRLSIVPTYLGAHAVPPEFSRRPGAYVDEIVRRTLPEVARRSLARYCDVFCEPGFFSVGQARAILRAAASLGLGLKIHADEFVASGGARLAAELGAASAEHLLTAPAEDRELLARSGVTAVLLPVTPIASLTALRSPGREMVDAGVPVALGTDLSPNSWVESMPLVLSLAVYSARLTPAEAITAGTVNAAHAIGAADSAGTIAPGRPADLVVFDLPSVEHVAYRFDVVPTLVFRQGKSIPPAEIRA